MVSFFHLPCVDSGLVIAPRDTWHVTILPFKKKKFFFWLHHAAAYGI